MSLIEIHKVSKVFGKIRALSSVTVNLEQGKHYVIRGASGSGKSTLLYLLGGLDRPTEGNIFVAGENLSAL